MNSNFPQVLYPLRDKCYTHFDQINFNFDLDVFLDVVGVVLISMLYGTTHFIRFAQFRHADSISIEGNWII